MNALVSHKIKHRSSAKDVFYTPKDVAVTHISQIKIKEDDVWYDPFYGKGIYYENFPSSCRKLFSEISLGKDFFKFTEKVDVICSNPPYSILDRVLEKCVELNPRVISLLLTYGALTPKRMEFMQSKGYGLTNIYTTKVFDWYGMTQAYTFVKGADWDSCKIVYDRVVHR